MLVEWYRQIYPPRKYEFLIGFNKVVQAHPIGLNWISGYTVILNDYCLDLSQQNLENFSLVGREEELKHIIQEVNRSNQPNVMLYGKPGSGKLSLVYGLAKMIQQNLIPKLDGYRVLLVNTDQIIANTSVEKITYTLSLLIGEAASAKNIVLCFPGFHQLTIAPIDISSVFEERLRLTSIRTIAITDLQNFHQTVKPNLKIMKHYNPIEVEEMSATDTLRVIIEKAAVIEKLHNIAFSYPALKELIKLTNNHMPNSPFPEKALDVFNDLVSQSSSNSNKIITREVVVDMVSKLINVPLNNPDQAQRDNLINLESVLKEKIIEQDQALEYIAKALRRAKTLVDSGDHPVGTFLFLGPTGTGKTETAKVLSKTYYGTTDLIRIDMSQFNSESASDRLLGVFNPPRQGFLAEKISQRPHGVLLLDEFEKAPMVIQHSFLPILDEGKFTDATGIIVDCRNLMIVATSNAGSEEAREYLRNHPKDDRFDQYMTEYLLSKKLFSPELLNRFDAIVYYQPLTDFGLKRVTELFLKNISKKLYNERGITLSFSPQLVDQIVKEGYDTNFGARSIKHYIQNTVEDSIAKQVLKNPNTKEILL